jgi:hypothetical protein
MKWFFPCKLNVLVWIVALIGVTSVACSKKDAVNLNYTEYLLPVSGTVRAMARTPDGYVFVGGDQGKPGFVVTADSSLSSFAVRKADFQQAVYGIADAGDRYILGMDDAQIVYSQDLSVFEYHTFLEENWPNEQYKLPLRDILISASSDTWYISGGGGFQFGLIFVSSDSGETWNPVEFPNEIHGMTEILGGVVAVGNGIVVTSSDQGRTWVRQRLDHELLTDVSDRITHSFQGDFFEASVDFTSFTKLETEGKPKYLQKLVTLPHPVFSHVAVGNLGNMAFVNRSGSIVSATLDKAVTLTDAYMHSQNELLVTAENGKLYLVRFPE